MSRQTNARLFSVVLAALCVCAPAVAGGAEPFSLAFGYGSAGAPPLTCEGGTLETARVYCTLAGSVDGAGAEAWAIGVRAPGRRIVRITLEGTWAQSALEDGTVQNEITTGEGNEGAVSFVTLGEGSSLGTFRDFEILALDVEGRAGEAFEIEYASDLVSTAGTPGNVVQVGGRTYAARQEPRTVPLTVIPHLGFSLENADFPLPFERILGGAAASGFASIGGAAGEAVETHAYLCLVLERAGSRYEFGGWSLGVAMDGTADLSGVTGRETAAAAYFTGFTRTELIDPARNGGQRGLVSAAAILEPDLEGTLPDRGTFSVADIRLSADLARCGAACEARLVFRDGLRGSGQPVQNFVALRGSSHRPCNFETASLTLRFAVGHEAFQRGNANGDGRLDISDPVFLLDVLFYGRAPSRCREAEDSNDDGRIDISDAIYVFGYLFLGSLPPPAPFPDCGLTPPDAAGQLGCLEPHAACP